MTEQATIVDFISASLDGMSGSGRQIFTPTEQSLADEAATVLDGELEEMVRELERVASCQQEDEVGDDAEPLPPFEAFCVGLGRIGDTLLPHLFRVFVEHFSGKDLPHDAFTWIVRARADAFVAYLLQIAQVHGLAFDDSLTRLGKAEQIALANLGARLRGIMQRETETL